jgi:hypothetical protein
VDGHPEPQGQGDLALGDIAVADAVSAVSGNAEGGVEAVEGLLGGPLGRSVVVVAVERSSRGAPARAPGRGCRQART